MAGNQVDAWFVNSFKVTDHLHRIDYKQASKEILII